MSAATKAGHRPDYVLLALFFLLVVAGLVILGSASSELGKIRFDDTYYYLKHQALYGLLPGILGFIIASRIHYQRYKGLSLIFLIVNIALLLLVFTPFGVVSGGAARWLSIGGFTFQPAELLKISFIMYIAAWLSNQRMDRVKDLKTGMLPFIIVCGVVGGLLIAQPATSTVAILLASGVVMYFVSGVPLRYLLGFSALGALALTGIIWSTPYRLERVKTFLNPSRDTQGASYQITQALITIGSGQATGLGYGNSTSKVNALPAPLDDSIFAIAAQELGFIGGSLLVIIFAFLVVRLLLLAKRSRDRFGHLMLVGFASVIALQSLVNMGSISGILPLTGVPLPFVSYGGTALAIFLTMGGISVNISKYS